MSNQLKEMTPANTSDTWMSPMLDQVIQLIAEGAARHLFQAYFEHSELPEEAVAEAVKLAQRSSGFMLGNDSDNIRCQKLAIEQFLFLQSRKKESTHKLSKLQKQILMRLLEKTRTVKNYSTKTIGWKWNQEDWLGGDLSREKEPILSRALRRLEGRGLVSRLSPTNRGEAPAKRTQYAGLTDLGLGIATQLAKEKP